MRARIKATGEIVEVEPLFYYDVNTSRGMIHAADIEFVNNPDDEKLYDLAKSAMQGYCSQSKVKDTYEEIAKKAVNMADKLLNELKKYYLK